MIKLALVFNKLFESLKTRYICFLSKENDSDFFNFIVISK